MKDISQILLHSIQMSSSDKHTVLNIFGKEIRTWFEDAYTAPTRIQEKAWKAISEDKNVLVIAPTGSGKTFAAFLYSINLLIKEKLLCEAEGRKWEPGVRVLYVSPLKALGVDIDRNLRTPIHEIAKQYDYENSSCTIGVGIRTGDTSPDERRKLQRNPPDILITTPESLYLILTSQAHHMLEKVETVIVDEIHSLASTKRGSHLSISLERLDDLLEKPAQRIGLSATVRPHDTVAQFLGGIYPVDIVSDENKPDIGLSIRVPVQDLTSIPPFAGKRAPLSEHTVFKTSKYRSALDPKNAWKTNRSLDAYNKNASNSSCKKQDISPDTRIGSSSIWPYMEATILEQVLSHRSTIVFVNSRGLCERLTARLNELYATWCGSQILQSESNDNATEITFNPAIRSSVGPTSEMTSPADTEIARAHHGSVSKEIRHSIESALKSGNLKCVVATSSLELGIDMGSVDLVLQVSPPLSVSSGLQRAGRADHRVGGRSNMVIYPKTRVEVADAAAMGRAMLEGDIENTELIVNPLDVLAQQTVAAVAMEPQGIDANQWFETARRSANYRTLSRRAFDSVILMLAGRYGNIDSAAFAPRIDVDIAEGVLRPLPRSQRIAVSSGGTIPDRGMYPVMLDGPSSASHKGRKRIGELDEEMVHESRVGDVIVLGTTTWRITDIADDRILVREAAGISARLPFWHGEGPGHDIAYGAKKGEFFRILDDGICKGKGVHKNEKSGCVDKRNKCKADFSDTSIGNIQISTSLLHTLDSIGLDSFAKQNLATLIAQQRTSTLKIPTDKTLVLEFSPDDSGGTYVILHSPFGKRVHCPWALAVSVRISERYGFDPQAQAVDSGIMLRIPAEEGEVPKAEDFIFDEDEIVEIITEFIPKTSLFTARFRECAARALLISSPSPGRRTPLWQQRIRGAQILEEAMTQDGFPIVVEAVRECLKDVYDLAGLKHLMSELQSGAIKIHSASTDILSPLATPIVFGYVAEHIYDNDRPVADKTSTLLSVDSELLSELLGTDDIASILDEDVVAEMETELQRTSPEWQCHGCEGVIEILRLLGPMDEKSLAKRIAPTDSTIKHSNKSQTNSKHLQYVKSLLENLEREHRIFEADLFGKHAWIYIGDAWRLQQIYGYVVPKWVQQAIDREQSYKPENSEKDDGRLIDGLIMRFARTHSLFDTESVEKSLGIAKALVEESLSALASTKRIKQVNEHWVESSILKRLRIRSLAKAREAIKPASAIDFCDFVLRYQGVMSIHEKHMAINNLDKEDSLDALANTISQFEGVFLPIEMWEETIFAARVPNYDSKMLDSLLESNEIIWICRPSAKGVSTECAFYPSDSPNAPYPLDLIGASLDIPELEGEGLYENPYKQDIPNNINTEPDKANTFMKQMIIHELSLNPMITFASLVDGIARRIESDIRVSDIAKNVLELLWDGQICVNSFAIARHSSVNTEIRSQTPSQTPTPRRVSSRRTNTYYHSDIAHAKRQARANVISRNSTMAALAGKWYTPIYPQRNPTEIAIETTESLLQRYGVVSGQIAAGAEVPGGLAGLYRVLQKMEDSGVVLRGVFVEGLGAAQFANKDTIETIREIRHSENNLNKSDSGELMETIFVIAADDPANIYGSVLPWPKGSGAKPSRKSGCSVIIRKGQPLLFCTKHMKAITLFTEDVNDIRTALRSLIEHTTLSTHKHLGKTHKKGIVISEIGGQDVLGSTWESILNELGFVRDTKGMRLLIDPF